MCKLARFSGDFVFLSVSVKPLNVLLSLTGADLMEIAIESDVVVVVVSGSLSVDVW